MSDKVENLEIGYCRFISVRDSSIQTDVIDSVGDYM
jgi:hypothetical protein